MIVATVPALFALVGLLMFALSGNPKVARIGEIMLFCGLLVALFVLSREGSVRIP